MISYNTPAASNGSYPGMTAATTPRTPNPETGLMGSTVSLWQSRQPGGTEGLIGTPGSAPTPSPQATIPGSEYGQYPPAPSGAAPPRQPPPPLSAIGSVAGPMIAKQPALTGPAIPHPVTVGIVF